MVRVACGEPGLARYLNFRGTALAHCTLGRQGSTPSATVPTLPFQPAHLVKPPANSVPKRLPSSDQAPGLFDLVHVFLYCTNNVPVC